MESEVKLKKELLVKVLTVAFFAKRNRFKIAVAESCTGGKISEVLSSISGSSLWFDFGIVCYSNWAKIFILEVQSGSLKKFGAVSDVVALEMVVGLDKKLQNRDECKWPTFCLSTTGITGPTGGLEKPLGLVWFGFNGPEGLKRQKKIFTGSRINIRDLAVDWALYILIMLSAK